MKNYDIIKTKSLIIIIIVAIIDTNIVNTLTINKKTYLIKSFNCQNNYLINKISNDKIDRIFLFFRNQ